MALLSDINNLQKRISDRSDEILIRFQALEIAEEFITERALFNEAFLETVNRINEYAIDFLIGKAVEAAVKTGEYTYPPLLNRLEDAIRIHREEIIFITPIPPSAAKIRVDLSSLGDIEEYAKVVTKVRKNVRKGTKGKPMPGDAASKIWREKIYGSAREGKQAYRYKYTDGKRRRVSTDYYAGMYEFTINSRLDLIPPDKAPFWYLIEHGNVSTKMSSDRGGGEPYPRFGATNFANKAERVIAKAFKDIYSEFKEKAEQFYSDILAKDFGISPGDTIKETIFKIVDETNKLVLSEKATLPSGKQNIITVQRGDIQIASYKEASGKVYTRARGTGGLFISLKGR